MKEINIPERKGLKIEQAYPSLNNSYFYIQNNNRVAVYYLKRGKRPKFSRYELKGHEIDIWKNINGRIKSKDILNKLKSHSSLWAKNGNSKNFYKTLRKWSSRRVQLIYILKEPLIKKVSPEPEESRLIKIGLDIIREVKTVEKTHKEYRSYNYHKKRIRNTKGHFEEVEKTLSHTLRDKTSVLGNNAYGGRLAESILAIGRFPNPARVLEIGAGLGWLGYNFIKKLKADLKGSDFRYSFLDLSAAFIKEQRLRNRSASNTCDFTQADACQLPFKNNSFDLVIANECIADFPVIKLAKNDISAASPGQNRVIRKGASYIRAINKFNKYLVPQDDLMPEFIFPIGIICFLEELKRILKPQGKAILVEYSSQFFKPLLVRLGGHFEYSPDFRLLKSVARNIGFKTKIQGIDKFLEINSVPLLSHGSREFLDKFLVRKTRKLNAQLYTKADLGDELGYLADKIKGLEFVSSKKEIGGFRPADFKVMLLRNNIV